jgi:hypothetical protein
LPLSTALPKIINRPQRPEIREIEAFRLILNEQKIKSSARHDVIDVPLAVIFPSHSDCKLSLYMIPEFIPSASHNFREFMQSQPSRFHEIPQSEAKIVGHS